MELICKLTPINGNVFVIDNKASRQTDSGIYIPETASPDKIVYGMVLKVSNKKDKKGNDIESEVKAGDLVLYSFHAGAGNVIEEDGRTLRVIKQVELIALCKD